MCSWSPRRSRGVWSRHRERGSYSRELKSLHSGIDYDGRGQTRERRRGEVIVIHRLCIMMRTICTWNVRGSGREEKWWGLQDLLKNWKVDMFTL